jgi:NTP pyrophosphatase (non-canonical NTP hydrolase)
MSRRIVKIGRSTGIEDTMRYHRIRLIPELATLLPETPRAAPDVFNERPDMTTFAAFAAANQKRCEAQDGFKHQLGSWSLSDWITATLGELGEAANIAKKLNRVRDGIPGNTLSPAELRARFREEIGDTVVYLDLLAASQGFTLEDAACEAFDRKSAEIGYPVRLCSPFTGEAIGQKEPEAPAPGA